MNLKLIRNVTLILALTFLSGGIGYRLGANGVKAAWIGLTPNSKIINSESPKNKNVDFSLFWTVWDEIQVKFVDKSKIDAQKMVYGAISGMVETLDDPYTVFLPPRENKEAKEQLNGNFEGIGAQLGVKDKRIIVVAPLSQSPAQTAGVKNGDWIIKVDGKETSGWTLIEAVSKIRGPKGTTVTLNVLHEGEEKPVDIKIVRNEIVLKSVDWKIVSASPSAKLKSAAYIQLARFGDRTDPQWDQVVNEVSSYVATASAKNAGVILDVRNNPGGYLSGAVYTAAEFLPRGTLVVKQVNYEGSVQSYSADRDGKLVKVPLVVLINQGTASASEILTGSMKVAGRIKVVGMKSFGKGSVQSAQDLPGGAGLHITSAKWLLSNDEWVQGKGLTPDIVVENDEKDPTVDLQLERAIEVLNGRKLN